MTFLKASRNQGDEHLAGSDKKLERRRQMKLKTKLMMFTAAAALSAGAAFAAINPDALAQSYLAEGYSYVEVKVGPTQTKVEAVKADRKVEVVYDNASGEVIKSEFDDADDDYLGKTGVEIKTTDATFEDGNDDEGDDSADDENDDSDDSDDEGDDSSDESDDGDDSDESDDSSDESDDDSSEDESDNDSSDNSDESDESDDGNDGDED
jgi:hypothetical protein